MDGIDTISDLGITAEINLRRTPIITRRIQEETSKSNVYLKDASSVATSENSLRKECNELLQRLESTAHDEVFISKSPKEAIFIDDMLLRLKIWAADVDLDGRGFESAGENGLLGAQLHARLDDIRRDYDSLIEALPASSSSIDRHTAVSQDKDEALAAYKSQFAQSVDSLASLTEPLKTINLPSRRDSLKTTPSESAALAERMKEIEWRSSFPSWVLLSTQHAVPNTDISPLLGAITLDASDPVKAFVANDGFTAGTLGESLVQTQKKSNFNIGFSSTSSRSFEPQLAASGVGVAGIGASAKVEHSRSKEWSFGIEGDVTIRQLSSPDKVLIYMLSAHKREVEKLLKSSSFRKAFMVVGIMSGRPKYPTTSSTGERVFALRYRTLKMNIFRSKINLGDPTGFTY